MALSLFGNSFAFAAPDCPVPAYAPRGNDQITDWYDKYIRPPRVFAGLPDSPRPTEEQIETLVEKLEAFHHRSIGDPLFFEPLVQQISLHFGAMPSFKGFSSTAAEKLYKSGAGSALDFSALCIDTRSVSFSDDTFAISLFGVNNYDCRHASLRGLVFTDSLINGAANAPCHADHIYYKNLIFRIAAGTNVVTFVCRKDSYGCLRL
ncbi:MAG TPA: hypothetical protein VGQ88_02925 [Burkholderiales bacterium]|nr:hypothetical protein [Burkholderiales bacterium]